MNFIFVSPHFPKTYWNFCDRLHRNGVNVLGIGDAPFDEIPWELKQCLTEYYRVNDLGNYDEMLRAGRVLYLPLWQDRLDRVQHEYWLEMDAQLRTDFNINTGAKNDFIERIKYKSKMKESYIAAGVPVARYHIVSTLAEARASSRRSAIRSSSSRTTAAVPRQPTAAQFHRAERILRRAA